LNQDIKRFFFMPSGAGSRRRAL